MAIEDKTYSITLFYATTFLLLAILIYYIIKKRPRIDSPVGFSLLLYVLYFIVAPLLDIITKNTSMAGVQLIGYYPLTQIVFTSGLLSFLFIYETTQVAIKKQFPEISSRTLLISALVWEVAGFLGYFIWTRKLGIPFFVINPFKLSNFYLMLGETSKKATGYLALSLLFFIPASLMLLELKIRKVIRFLPCIILPFNFIILFTRGVRYIMLIFIGSLILYYLKRTGKRLNRLYLIFILLAGVFIFSIVAYLRGAPSLSSITINTDFIFAFFASSLSLFKPTTALIRYIPRHHPFILGESFFYTFLMPIPRILWQNKPYPEFLKIIWTITGGRFFGYAVPNVGEYYANFGIPGTVVLMGFLGFIFKLVYNTYKRYQKTEIVLMTYSIFLFYLFQVISRGYFPQVFAQGLYLFTPLIFLNLTNRRDKK